MTTPPEAYLRHLDAAVGADADALRSVWEPEGILEFPYATSLGTPTRVSGVEAIVDYFGDLGLFGPFTFSDVRAWSSGPREWVVELHGSSTLLPSGAPYEQDYVVRLGLSERGRLAWMREFWDPTRAAVTGPGGSAGPSR